MNKRLSIKLHKKYLVDIIYEISVSKYWRKRLFDSDNSEKLLINYRNLNDLPNNIKVPIAQYKLQYFVYKTEDVLDDDIYYDGGVFFQFEAVKFKNVTDFSFNNTGII